MRSPNTSIPLGTPLNRSHPLSQSLNVDFLLNEGGGMKSVDSVTNKIGTLTNFALSGSSSNWLPSQKGTCLNFDGTNDYIAFPDSSILQVESKPFSISLWVNLNAQPAAAKAMIFMLKCSVDFSGLGWGFIYDFRSGTKQLDLVKAGVADQRVNCTLANNTWYHIVAVSRFNGGTPSSVVYYVNGVSQGSVSNSSAYQSSSGKALDIGGGTNTYSGATPLNGFLKDVKIYGRGLLQQEAQQLYINSYQMFQSKKSGI